MWLYLWRRFAAWSLGSWVGAAFAILVMLHWASEMDSHGWDGTTAPDSLFVAYLMTALIGGIWLWRAVYRWAATRMDAYDATQLRKRWIDRRRDREMCEFTQQTRRQSAKNQSSFFP